MEVTSGGGDTWRGDLRHPGDKGCAVPAATGTHRVGRGPFRFSTGSKAAGAATG